jgi:hypothetical protein
MFKQDFIRYLVKGAASEWEEIAQQKMLATATPKGLRFNIFICAGIMLIDVVALLSFKGLVVLDISVKYIFRNIVESKARKII